jgi:hypothetical protein
MNSSTCTNSNTPSQIRFIGTVYLYNMLQVSASLA